MAFDKLTERIITKGEIVTKTPLHIGSGKKDIEIGEADMPIITDTLEQPYIPGSSLKGKVRSEAERIARQKGHSNICTPPSTKNMCGTISPSNICICCRIFGTAGDKISIASKTRFRDSYPVDKVENLITRAGTALDRKTGSVSRGSLYHTEAVPAGTRFSLEIVCDNMNQEEINLLKAALKSVQDSSLGGLSSRGFGKVKFNITGVTRRNSRYYLGEEEEKQVSGTELEAWRKDIETSL